MFSSIAKPHRINLSLPSVLIVACCCASRFLLPVMAQSLKAAKPLVPAKLAGTTDQLVYIGTYGTVTPDGGPPPGHNANPPGGSGDAEALSHQGIYAARLDSNTGRLTGLGMMIKLQRTSWLRADPRHSTLYSTGLIGDDMSREAEVFSMSVDQASGKLTLLNAVGSGGQDSTDLDLDRASTTLFVANHGDGTVAALAILPDGSLGEVSSRQQDTGSGPSPRQVHPKVHGVLLDPSQRYLLAADFGADRIFFYQFDAAARLLKPSAIPFEQVPPGSGPRHLAFHPNGRFLFLNTEMTAEIRSYSWEPQSGKLHLLQVTPTYPKDFTGEKSAAEMVISNDGRYLYVSLRGNENAIVVYAVAARTGYLKEIQRVPSEGKIPWSFAVDPTGQWMLVANLGSGTVNVLHVDTDTGVLKATKESIAIPDPNAVAFYSSR